MKPFTTQVYTPLSPLEQKLVSTRQTYQFMLRDGINQTTNGLHNTEELLICNGSQKRNKNNEWGHGIVII